MLIVALTGGIGSGKSTVANAFAQRGVPVVDTDLIARELVAPGLPAYQAIVDHFGKRIVLDNGKLDRQRLRDIVFADPGERTALENILHPRIREEVESRIGKLEAPYCLVVIPLLTETGGYPFIDRVLLVDLAEEEQIRRTMTRDNLDREQVRQILASQSSREQRRARADEIIDNSGDPTALDEQIEALHRQYCELASSKFS